MHLKVCKLHLAHFELVQGTRRNLRFRKRLKIYSNYLHKAKDLIIHHKIPEKIKQYKTNRDKSTNMIEKQN